MKRCSRCWDKSADKIHLCRSEPPFTCRLFCQFMKNQIIEVIENIWYFYNICDWKKKSLCTFVWNWCDSTKSLHNLWPQAVTGRARSCINTTLCLIVDKAGTVCAPLSQQPVVPGFMCPVSQRNITAGYHVGNSDKQKLKVLPLVTAALHSLRFLLVALTSWNYE